MTNLRPIDALMLVGVVATASFVLGLAASSQPPPPPTPPISVKAATEFFVDEPLVIEGWLADGRLCQTRGCATGPALEIRGAAPAGAHGHVFVLGIVRGNAVVLTPLARHSEVAHL
jgi:hypothetical protein